MRPGRRARRGPGPGSVRGRSGSQSGGRQAGRGRSGGSSSRGKPTAYGDGTDLLFVQRAAVSDPVTVEVDRPLAFRPRLMGFWRGTEFYQVVRVVSIRLEYDVTYHRVLTDRGAFDLRHLRRMDPVALRARRIWEVCAELDTLPVARLP